AVILIRDDTANCATHTLSLHDALPIWPRPCQRVGSSGQVRPGAGMGAGPPHGSGAPGPSEMSQLTRRELEVLKLIALGLTNRERSEEHTSELQSLAYIVCRLLLEIKTW